MRDPGLLGGGPCDGARGGPRALGGVGAKTDDPRIPCMVLGGGARPLACEARVFGGRDMAVSSGADAVVVVVPALGEES